jgi:hypothetical protein
MTEEIKNIDGGATNNVAPFFFPALASRGFRRLLSSVTCHLGHKMKGESNDLAQKKNLDLSVGPLRQRKVSISPNMADCTNYTNSYGEVRRRSGSISPGFPIIFVSILILINGLVVGGCFTNLPDGLYSNGRLIKLDATKEDFLKAKGEHLNLRENGRWTWGITRRD